MCSPGAVKSFFTAHHLPLQNMLWDRLGKKCCQPKTPRPEDGTTLKWSRRLLGTLTPIYSQLSHLQDSHLLTTLLAGEMQDACCDYQLQHSFRCMSMESSGKTCWGQGSVQRRQCQSLAVPTRDHLVCLQQHLPLYQGAGEGTAETS